MYKSGRTGQGTRGHGRTRTHLFKDRDPQRHLSPSRELMPTHSVHMSSMKPLQRVFIEPVQAHLGVQAGLGPRRMLGVGMGLETWRKRDLIPLLMCRACHLLLESGSPGAAD